MALYGQMASPTDHSTTTSGVVLYGGWRLGTEGAVTEDKSSPLDALAASPSPGFRWADAVISASACLTPLSPSPYLRLTFAEISNVAQGCLLVERVGFWEEGVAVRLTMPPNHAKRDRTTVDLFD